ncbi:MAG: spore coat associated protein CotJA [Clostridia bacterium]|nr:spore coat associated protein CotJA [Clostridia bacterium]
MEYRKNARTPLDRADELFLQKILEENAAEERYGEIMSNRGVHQNSRARSGCGCAENTRNVSSDNRSGCGCGIGARNRRSDNDDNDNRSGCGCGVGSRNRRSDNDNDDNRSGCGYGIGARNRRSDNDVDNRSGCGCGTGRESRNEGHDDSYGCGCGNGRTNAIRDGFPLAMVYSPVQEWRELLEEEEALMNGTLFRELVFPWYPAACRGENNCGCQGGER